MDSKSKTASTVGDRLSAAFEQWASRPALRDSLGHSLSYRELDELSQLLASCLQSWVLSPSDRVGICVGKSACATASVCGVLRAGAAYVPVDATAPMSKNAMIFTDCSVSVVIVTEDLREPLAEGLKERGQEIDLLVLPGKDPGEAKAALLALRDELELPSTPSPSPEPEDLAYILYTSGSTGVPKGVMLTHRHCLDFVDWAVGLFEPTPEDICSSHARFTFDLSILDIFMPLFSGSCSYVIDEALAAVPTSIPSVIAENRISIWYSAPSVLALMNKRGHLERHDCSSLRLVLFAGEVFPLPQLRALLSQWTTPRFYNLYGPTETNVCTYFEVQRPLGTEVDSLPIGRLCPQYEMSILDSSDREVAEGGEGELCIGGPVMVGYWNRDELNQRAFFTADDGKKYYRTGDIVRLDNDGNLLFLGRRDRMVKRLGYRVELGEIEAALHANESVGEAAVVALEADDGFVRIRAVIAPKDGKKLSTLRMKAFCSKVLVNYMIPDEFKFVEALPRTRTGKVDLGALRE